MDVAKVVDKVVASFIGTKREHADPNRRTSSLKGVLASKKGKKMSFAKIRKAAAKTLRKRA